MEPVALHRVSNFVQAHWRIGDRFFSYASLQNCLMDSLRETYRIDEKPNHDMCIEQNHSCGKGDQSSFR
jgi:hypothetical protein